MAVMKQPSHSSPGTKTSASAAPAVIPFLERPKPSVSVIIPTHNKANDLNIVLPRIPRWVHEVLLVDDKSTDDTVALAQSLRPDIKILRAERPGRGAALRTGF